MHSELYFACGELYEVSGGNQVDGFPFRGVPVSQGRRRGPAARGSGRYLIRPSSVLCGAQASRVFASCFICLEWIAVFVEFQILVILQIAVSGYILCVHSIQCPMCEAFVPDDYVESVLANVSGFG